MAIRARRRTRAARTGGAREARLRSAQWAGCTIECRVPRALLFRTFHGGVPLRGHITSAIGGAVAAAAGADFLCYVTPAEHLRLPTLEDVKEGIVAARIAAHAADLVKDVRGAQQWDDRMSHARHDLDWEKMFSLALDPEKARRYRAESPPQEEDTCTMCGRLCAVRTMNNALQS